jgi:hypothetical protein
MTGFSMGGGRQLASRVGSKRQNRKTSKTIGPACLTSDSWISEGARTRNRVARERPAAVVYAAQSITASIKV